MPDGPLTFCSHRDVIINNLNLKIPVSIDYNLISSFFRDVLSDEESFEDYNVKLTHFIDKVRKRRVILADFVGLFVERKQGLAESGGVELGNPFNDYFFVLEMP